MDAGHAYNDFPYMNGQWVPDEYWATPGWRGFFENTAAVQLHHRLLASTTLVSVLTTWAMFRGRILPPASRQLLNGLAAVTALQVRPQDMLAFLRNIHTSTRQLGLHRQNFTTQLHVAEHVSCHTRLVLNCAMVICLHLCFNAASA